MRAELHAVRVEIVDDGATFERNVGGRVG